MIRAGFSWRAAAAGLATLVALAILISLGLWQLQRKAWKEDLVGRIEARAFGAPAPLPPDAAWARWSPAESEYGRVRLTGTFLADKEVPIHGLMAAERGRPLQGFYLFVPFQLASGAVVIVNRGFVPTELRDPSRRPGPTPSGETTITGLQRAAEMRGWFVPANDLARNEWFVRDLGEIATSRGLARVAPFYIDEEAAPDPRAWPRGGQTRLSLPNDHLQYALTWFGLALTLIGVAGSAALRSKPTAHEKAGHEGPA